ncbi:hypothetical protein Axy23_050 [Achromobacter phage vB_AxyP_19-32_Axy23]|uniref:Uncharacterized protein n=1 Tax=Achromobacter phage vB_AxyP_19-32_Axy23 TaxID=2591047 RepID=A0A514CW53_9CAUD|nr:hypothetical protein Axy23_050 [Achromobacter phage vB_AxyP_19-32_Axy23]
MPDDSGAIIHKTTFENAQKLAKAARLTEQRLRYYADGQAQPGGNRGPYRPPEVDVAVTGLISAAEDCGYVVGSGGAPVTEGQTFDIKYADGTVANNGKAITRLTAEGDALDHVEITDGAVIVRNGQPAEVHYHDKRGEHIVIQGTKHIEGHSAHIDLPEGTIVCKDGQQFTLRIVNEGTVSFPTDKFAEFKWVFSSPLNDKPIVQLPVNHVIHDNSNKNLAVFVAGSYQGQQPGFTLKASGGVTHSASLGVGWHLIKNQVYKLDGTTDIVPVFDSAGRLAGFSTGSTPGPDLGP